jgi:hypothetical protein
MAGQVTTDSPYDVMLKGFINTYVEPVTNWTRAFSPTMYFGCNVEDISTEQHVLNSVGSYGSQINRIIDVVSLLLPTLKTMKLTDRQRTDIENFERLAKQADEASSTYRGRSPRSITLDEVDEFVERMNRLATADPAQYKEAISRVRAGTAESAGNKTA